LEQQDDEHVHAVLDKWATKWPGSVPGHLMEGNTDFSRGRQTDFLRRRTMRKTTAIAVAGTAAALLGAAPAHADTVGFLNAAHRDGITDYIHGDEALLNGAIRACAGLDVGVTLRTTLRGVMRDNPAMSPQLAGDLLGDTITYLCPSHISQGLDEIRKAGVT
jgi:hypothetical protein